MQQLIEKSQKMTALLIEYREAKIYERCIYHLVKQPDRINWFFLIEIETGTIKKDGTPGNIKKWLRLRKINPWKVYKIRDLFK